MSDYKIVLDLAHINQLEDELEARVKHYNRVLKHCKTDDIQIFQDLKTMLMRIHLAVKDAERAD